MTDREQFLHLKWCSVCGSYTVHDAGTCIACKANNDEPPKVPDKSVPADPEPTE